MSTTISGRLAASLAALAAAGLIDGCDVFDPGDSVTVRLPDPPPHWQRAFPGLRFELEYPGPGGELSVAGPFGWGEAVRVVCSREANGAFLAWPLLDGDRRRLLRPAGGLYPLDLREEDGAAGLDLTWVDGCQAVVMLRLRVAGRDTALVNAERLGGYLAAEPDPWRWDLTHIEQRLADGSFGCRDIDLLPAIDAVVQPGEGEWFLETPFGVPLEAGPGGTLSLPGLPFGLHTLFSPDGRRVRLYADGRGVFALPMERIDARSNPAPIRPRASPARTGARRTRARSRREAA
jgi:hypothetical protein